MSDAPNLKSYIEKLMERIDLSREEAQAGCDAIVAGVDPCQTAAFLTLLRAKGETAAECVTKLAP